ncbi:SAM-dependent methyltransferase [Streptomyces sp. NPDC050085]|uniref:SAM-dependent methyltransferase n=1 Tax=Streptomyces sp. NPDC050085 TaxID=3365600 RepID=UPI0037B322B1
MDASDRSLPRTIDITQPNLARMHDYYLGGKDNYPADRKVCEDLLEFAPSTRAVAASNRHFLQRLIPYLATEHHIRQFLDLGSGLPTQNNTHDIAQAAAPEARVVYVDNDPMVFAHSRALLAGARNTAVLHADLRSPKSITQHPEVKGFIDFHQPVAALYVSVLHCIPDDDQPEKVLRDMAALLPAGSVLVVSQLISDDAAMRDTITDLMRDALPGQWGKVRRRQDVEGYFRDLELLKPGLVDVSTWPTGTVLGPRPSSKEWIEYGGIGKISRRTGW